MADILFTHATSVGEARAILKHRLNDGSEADSLLCHTLACERADLHAHPETPLQPIQQRQLDTLMNKRLSGSPLAYLTGQQEFFSLQFEVTPAVLIPRPETETLVEVALAQVPQNARILDLGTGCGAIAITLACTRPDAVVTACDNSRDALAVAMRNAQRLNAPNVSFVQSDWFKRLPEMHYDLIISNPPYVDRGDLALDPAVTAHEPLNAVIAPQNGLACLRQIIAAAPAWLADHGALAVEHGYTQGHSVARLMQAAGFNNIRRTSDPAGHPRVTVGVRPSEAGHAGEDHEKNRG